jgi:peptidoglycan L-alanyl-D-glutamate endopeptidase CwlK
MPGLGANSQRKLSTCHPDLIRLIERAAQYYEFTVTCGHRGEKEQNVAYDNKRSKVRYPNSRHNRKPSRAVDLAPIRKVITDDNREKWFIDWNDIGEFRRLGMYVEDLAMEMDIKIKWGGRFKSFVDMPHFQLIE